VCRILRRSPQHAPLFGDLAVAVEPENVHASSIAIARPCLMTMQDDAIAPGDNASKMAAPARIFPHMTA
jgi:hypothetical protein